MLMMFRVGRTGIHAESVARLGSGLLLALVMAISAAAQDVPSDADLFDATPASSDTGRAGPPSKTSGDVTAAKLVRVVQDAKVLYADRTRKIVYDCKLYSDDSRVYHGKYVEFYRNGKQFCSGQYRDGRREGKWTFLYPNGSVAKEGTYVDDKPTGKWVYTRSDGRKMREEVYKDGVPDGTWVSYGADGRTVASTVQFANGKLVRRPSS